MESSWSLQHLVINLTPLTTLPTHKTRALEKRATFDENVNVKLAYKSPLIPRGHRQVSSPYQVSKETVLVRDVTIDSLFSKLGEVCHETGRCETTKLASTARSGTRGTAPPSK